MMDRDLLLDPTKPLPDGYRRGFYEHNRSWYAFPDQQWRDTFMIGIYHEEGGCAGEFEIRRNETLRDAYQLRVFHEAWPLLPRFPDLIAWLSRNPYATPEQLRAGLISCGIVDLTATEMRR